MAHEINDYYQNDTLIPVSKKHEFELECSRCHRKVSNFQSGKRNHERQCFKSQEEKDKTRKNRSNKTRKIRKAPPALKGVGSINTL